MKYSHRHPGKYGSNTPNGKYIYKKRPMHVQTLIFPKNRFTRNKAIDWAKEHGFKGSTSREEGNSIRVRQFSPEDVKRYGGTFPIGKDVKGVYAEVKLEKYKNKDYKYLKDKFNISKTGDDDKDKVINKDDCRPWDKKRQDEDEPETYTAHSFEEWKREKGRARYYYENELQKKKEDLKQEIERLKKEIVKMKEEKADELERIKLEIEDTKKQDKEDYDEYVRKSKEAAESRGNIWNPPPE